MHQLMCTAEPMAFPSTYVRIGLANGFTTDSDFTTWLAAEADHIIRRMRLLACRGEAYSPLLTLDELAAELRANGIVLG